MTVKTLVAFISLTFIAISVAELNLYIDKAEVLRLLGVGAELYYIRNGFINQNALNHVIIIPHNVTNILFKWQSLISEPIPYVVSLGVSDNSVLEHLKINVSDIGDIPVVESVLSVMFPSCDIISLNYTLYIDLAVTLNKYADNITQINFKRRRLCFQGSKEFVNSSSSVSVPTNSFQQKLFYVVLCLGTTLVTICVVLFLMYYVCSGDIKRFRLLTAERNVSVVQNKNTETVFRPIVLPPSQPYNTGGTSTSSNTSHASLRRRKMYAHVDYNSIDIQERVAEITIQRKRVRLRKVELEGTFGKVYHGTYIKEDGSEDYVIVKTVMDFASPTQISALLKEGLLMYGLKHKNIMSVLGVSIEDHAEPFVVYQRQDFSNLKKFLQKCKLSLEGVTHTLTTQEVVRLALQIVSGVQYMHRKKILHKDLATRNCLIDSSLNVKVTDNALSRDLFPNDYHCLGDNENRPVKWLAVESLVNRTFSPASDVWAFGVTLWELTTLAQQPYAEVDPFEIEHYLKDGYRLSQPVNCPDDLFAVMAYCWAMSPDERPSFSQLHTCLEDFYAQLNKYV